MTGDERGRITLPFGQAGGRYGARVDPDGTITLTPLTGDDRPWANGHQWPCARFYTLSSPSDRCSCSARNTDPDIALEEAARERAEFTRLARKYDLENHHNAALCPYCTPQLPATGDGPTDLESLARWMLNTVDPAQPGPAVRAQCVGLVRGLAER